MRATAWRSVGIIGVAAASALVIWAAARLLGIELTVGKGPDASQVGVVDVLLTTVVAGLLAWGTHRLLARSVRTLRWWPFVGSTAIAVSMLGPSYLADGAAAAAALIAMHLAVGAVLVYGFARYMAQPSWTGASR
jgi:Zn-dependent alcohol dehydrogenase